MTTDAPVSASRGPTLSGVGWCDDIALSSVRFGSYVPRMPLGPRVRICQTCRLRAGGCLDSCGDVFRPPGRQQPGERRSAGRRPAPGWMRRAAVAEWDKAQSVPRRLGGDRCRGVQNCKASPVDQRQAVTQGFGLIHEWVTRITVAPRPEPPSIWHRGRGQHGVSVRHSLQYGAWLVTY